MARKQKKKSKTKLQKIDVISKSTDELLSKNDFCSDELIRLKLTARKGVRIESVPLIKLEKLSNKKMRYWKLEEGWLVLYGLKI